MNQEWLSTMLELQDKINYKIDPNWKTKNYEYYRAAWIECGELLDHYGYKWWKQQSPDIDQIKLEVIDIWHFGLSMILLSSQKIDSIIIKMNEELNNYVPEELTIPIATENLVKGLINKNFCLKSFFNLLYSTGMTLEELYFKYVGKNILNIFRQDNGYKQGTYIKIWNGKEDNEHLTEIMTRLDPKSDFFIEAITGQLEIRYREARLKSKST